MNSYFEQGAFYGAQATSDHQAYRFSLGLGGVYPQTPKANDYESSNLNACKIYQSPSTPTDSQYKVDCVKSQNEFNSPTVASAAVAAAAANSLNSWSSASIPMRPSVCAPDPSRYGDASLMQRDRGLGGVWNAHCTLNSAQQMQQNAGTAFYPWMAIAGKSSQYLFTMIRRSSPNDH